MKYDSSYILSKLYKYSSKKDDIFCITSLAKHIGVSHVSELYDHDHGQWYNIGITLQVKKSIHANER